MAEGVHPRGTCARRAVQLKKIIMAQPDNKQCIFAALLKDVIMQPPGSNSAFRSPDKELSAHHEQMSLWSGSFQGVIF